MLLSIIIPCYNERATIREVIGRVRALGLEKEIIVVDGNSDDGTAEVLREEEGHGDLIVVYQPERRGRGHALRLGMERAGGEVMVFQDADLELNPGELPALLRPIVEGKADVVFGSRFLKGRPEMTFLQYWGNRVITITMNVLFGTRLTDAETCYQMFRSDLVRNLEFHCDHFTFTIELALHFIRRKARIGEVAVSYVPRGRDEGKKLYWGDGFLSLWFIVRERFRGGG